MDLSLKEHVPWQVKIAVKIVLSRLPFGYRFWEKLSLFKHGEMERPEYAFGAFRKHFDRVEFTHKSEGFVALELGPGDSLFSDLIAKAFGASKTYLVDVGPFADLDLAPYRRMASFLTEGGFSVPDLQNCHTWEKLAEACSAHYLTEGIHSLQDIPSSSVDFVWSQAVLEHVRRDDFLPIFRELRRIQRTGGIGSHRVDLQDHLGGALNNLRFQTRTWESAMMSNSGFYTNRIRYSEMLDLFKQAGFQAEVAHADRWATVPTPRRKMAPPFRGLPEEELTISSFDVVLH